MTSSEGHRARMDSDTPRGYGVRGDVRKRDHAVESLEVAIARHLHIGWCDVPGHSYGDYDYKDAAELATVIRAHVAAGGVL